MAEEQQERRSNYIISAQLSSAAPFRLIWALYWTLKNKLYSFGCEFAHTESSKSKLTAQTELSSGIAAESQPNNYVFKKKGN